MPTTLDEIDAENGAIVDPKFIPTALTAGKFQFDNGATQEFNSDAFVSQTKTAPRNS